MILLDMFYYITFLFKISENKDSTVIQMMKNIHGCSSGFARSAKTPQQQVFSIDSKGWFIFRNKIKKIHYHFRIAAPQINIHDSGRRYDAP